jgi:prepilin-type N-terminal cleavage/methylation domain-containing protein
MIVKTSSDEKRQQKGFTLVELVVVMAILVLLTALAVPKFTAVLANARTDANESNKKLLQEAVDLYISSENVAPAEVDDLQDLLDQYLKEVPSAPAGYSPYTVTDGIVGGGEPE